MKINKGNDAFYFGCKNNKVGHYLHNETLRAIHSNIFPKDFPTDVGVLDGGLLPLKQPEIEGRASIVHINGWTIMSFWDKSVDKRGKSNCAFLFRGHYTFNEVCEMARERFPSIMN
jgi:hypothetical protein